MVYGEGTLHDMKACDPAVNDDGKLAFIVSKDVSLMSVGTCERS
mgnify:CR=1 FL=1